MDNDRIKMSVQDLDHLEKLLDQANGLTSIPDQVLLYLQGKLNGNFSERIRFKEPELKMTENLKYIFDEYLCNHTMYLKNEGNARYQITPKGYEHLNNLKYGPVLADKNVFCAMWFDNKNNETGIIWEKGIKPAIIDSEFKPIRIDEKEHNDKIDDMIIIELRKAKFVIADHTHGKDGVRGSVYFEIGYAMGLKKTVIHSCREDQVDSLPFDVRQYNVITWASGKENDFRIRLERRINATIDL